MNVRNAPAAEEGWRPLQMASIQFRLPTGAFGRLGVVHAAMAGGDALVTLALAGSLFFSISPDAAKSKVLLYLVLSLAPFVVVSPFIGPLIDRISGEQHWVLFGSAAARAVLCMMMAGHLHSLLLFPEAFGALVAAKAYAVARSSLVPAVVHSDAELVQANSRLSLIAGFGGMAALLPGGLLAKFAGSSWVLRLGFLVFVGASVLALRVRIRARDAHAANRAPGPVIDVNDAHDPLVKVDAARRQAVVRVSAFAVATLRGVIGFLTFLVLFSFRRAGAPLWWSGLVAASAGISIQLGALLAMRLQRRTSEQHMIVGALMSVAVAAGAASMAASRPAAAIVAGMAGMAGSVGRLAFDSIVQRDGAADQRGTTFARYETRFQLVWVLGALLPVAVSIPRSVGFAMIALAMVAALAVSVIGEPALEWMRLRRRAVGDRWTRPARRNAQRAWHGEDD